jgi:hypothetical protein
VKHASSLVALFSGVFLLSGVTSAGERRNLEVTDPAGRTIKVPGDHNRQTTSRLPGAASDSAEGPSRRPPVPCLQGTAAPGLKTRESRSDGYSVDACGRIVQDGSRPSPPARARRHTKVAPVSAGGDRVTIDRITTRGSGGTYTPGGTVLLLGSADTYFLSDGTSWVSGAGTFQDHSTSLERVEVTGSTVRYVLAPPPLFLYEQTDFDSGDHSAQGTLSATGSLVLEATIGSTDAVIRGNALIVANDATSYGEPRFNFYSSIVGSVVPFEETYTILEGQTWQADTFSHAFSYGNAGAVDFAHPVSVPRAVGLEIKGPPRIPDQTPVQFRAAVRYENGVLRPVTAEATWGVEPAATATISAGLLTTAPLTVPQQTLTVTVRHTEGAAVLAADKTVVCTADHSVAGPGAWPMYQANARHTGYAPVSLLPDQFALRWQRDVGAGFPLNPPTSAEGKVFASLQTYFNDVPTLFALDGATGEPLWSKNYGPVFSVNPPSFAYGMVYVQTGNSDTDTWLRAYDAGTGELSFEAPHSAQWERYFAPTIDATEVFVNGGTYGGMYAFDAFSGAQRWFLGLPQYDEWTPAVADGLAYSYVGEYQPGLYAAQRTSGNLAFVVPDGDFEWDGWSMNLAPVIGAHDDVIVIHDGRLISFDRTARSIRWQVASGFQGQPTVARDRIYAVNAGRLVVLDEVSHSELWSWQPPEGVLASPMIVTDSHVLGSTDTTVYAVDLSTRESVWSFPAAGHLALADGTLYVAASTGVLTAISMPDAVPSPVVSLEIVGPAEVTEGSSAQYRALAHYADGRTYERTFVSEWSVRPATFASITSSGLLNVTELLQPFQDVKVKARYTENGRTVEAQITVRLVIGVDLTEFVRRNLAATVGIKEKLASWLDVALARERAVRDVLSSLSLDSNVAVPLLQKAIREEKNAKGDIVDSQQLLGRLLELVDGTAGPSAAGDANSIGEEHTRPAAQSPSAPRPLSKE